MPEEPCPNEPIPMIAHLIEKCRGQEQYIVKLEEAIEHQNEVISTIRNALGSILSAIAVVEDSAEAINSVLNRTFASLK